MAKKRNKYVVVLVYMAISLATFIAFEQVRNNEFVYDDAQYVTKNPHVTSGITSESIIWAFTSGYGSNWHPLTWLSHMLDCELFGLNARWHHIVNLLFHIANSLLLFWVLKRMTGAVWASGFVAAAFALHPLHVESVAWVAERKDVLSCFFWMLTVSAYVLYVERPGICRYLPVFLFFGLGLLAKPMLVTLPFVLLLLDYWPLGRFSLVSRKRGNILPSSKPQQGVCRESSALSLIWEKIPLFTLSAVSSMITYMVQRGAGSMVETLPLGLRVSNAMVSYLHYIAKIVYPSRLAVLYPYPAEGITLWKTATAFLALVCISACLITAGRRRKYLTTGWLWYVGTLVPVIGLVQVGVQAIADRYMYIPAVGIFIVFAWGGAELFGRWRYRRIGLGICAGLVLFAMMINTRMQIRCWKDRSTLYRHALEVTENNHIMHNNYGGVLLKQGRVDDAIKHIQEALRINPYYTKARRHLAFAFAEQGRLEEATEEYWKLLQKHPGDYKALNGLGVVLAREGRFEKAIKLFREALRIKPDFVNAQNNLELTIARQKKLVDKNK